MTYILSLLLAIFIAMSIASLFNWVLTGMNLIEQMDEICGTDIDGMIDRLSNAKDLKRFKRGNQSVVLARKDGYWSPEFISYKYDIPFSKATQQEVFDFNLEVLKCWMMFRGTDVTWENIAQCICEKIEIFKSLITNFSDTEPVLLPKELSEELYKNKNAFYNNLCSLVNMKNYERDWTILHFSAEHGEQFAVDLLNWVEEQNKNQYKIAP